MQTVLEGAGDDDEEVQSIPRVGQIGVLAPHAHRHHFDGHLQREEGEDDVVEELEQCFDVFWNDIRNLRSDCTESLIYGRDYITEINVICMLTCSTLHLLVTQSSSTHGWYMPSVMQFSKMTRIDTRSNHVHDIKSGPGLG